MATHVSPDGIRVTLADRTAKHQIRLTFGSGGHGNFGRVFVGCTCGAPSALSTQGVEDQWVIYAQLSHRGDPDD